MCRHAQVEQASYVTQLQRPVSDERERHHNVLCAVNHTASVKHSQQSRIASPNSREAISCGQLAMGYRKNKKGSNVFAINSSGSVTSLAGTSGRQQQRSLTVRHRTIELVAGEVFRLELAKHHCDILPIATLKIPARWPL